MLVNARSYLLFSFQASYIISISNKMNFPILDCDCYFYILDMLR